MEGSHQRAKEHPLLRSTVQLFKDRPDQCPLSGVKRTSQLAGVLSFRVFQQFGHQQTSGDHLIFRDVGRRPREGGRALKDAL